MLLNKSSRRRNLGRTCRSVVVALLFVPGTLLHAAEIRAPLLATEVRGGEISGMPRVQIAAVRSPEDGSLTVLIVNDADQPWTARLAVEGVKNNLAALCSSPEAKPADVLRYETNAVSGGALELKPFSLTILTDSPLPADGPGRF